MASMRRRHDHAGKEQSASRRRNRPTAHPYDPGALVSPTIDQRIRHTWGATPRGIFQPRALSLGGSSTNLFTWRPNTGDRAMISQAIRITVLFKLAIG